MGPVTLDQACLALVRLGPGDPHAMRVVGGLLTELADGGTLAFDAEVQLRFAAQALLRRADAADGDEAADAAAIADAGRRLEQAQAARNTSGAGVGTEVPVDEELVREFVAESADLVDRAEAALLLLDTDPGDAASLDAVFRAWHTIKSTAAFVGLHAAERLAHAAEELFERFRAGTPWDAAAGDLGHRAADALRALLAGADALLAGGEPPAPAGLDALMADLERYVARAAAPGEAVGAGVDARSDAVSTDEEQTDASADGPADVVAAASTQTAAGEADCGFLRVRTDRLDRLVDMVGELVIAQSMIQQAGEFRGAEQTDFGRKVGHASKIIRELQELSVSMRMMPLRATFGRVRRLVRDLSRRSGKPLELRTQGEDTELDRALVDGVAEPLVHLVRNAVDHGIEPADVRVRAGKPAAGTLTLRAFHAGGDVVVELGDDGAGLDRGAILRAAVARGAVAEGADLSDADVHDLIFAPGLSTAERVTDLSGRGVGMDVVRRTLEGLRGSVEVASRPGEGTLFTLRLPLTLAVTDGMLVRVGRERYLVPTTAIRLSYRPEAGALQSVAGQGEIALWRGEPMPLVRLHRLYRVDDAQTDPAAAILMVVGAGTQRAALLVDEILGQQQVVAKPLPGLGSVPGVRGGAVLGDGRVGLILDVPDLLAFARSGAAAPAAA